MFIMTFTADTAAASVLERVLAQAEAELNWPRSQVEASVIDVLTRDGCTFYGVRNKQQMDGPRYGYVALPDGSILGVREENRAERALNACGRGADSVWWAGVIARLENAGGVLVTETAPLAIQQIRKAGIENALPDMKRSADGTVLLHFHTYDPDRNLIHQVDAILPTQGHLEIRRSGNPAFSRQTETVNRTKRGWGCGKNGSWVAWLV